MECMCVSVSTFSCASSALIIVRAGNGPPLVQAPTNRFASAASSGGGGGEDVSELLLHSLTFPKQLGRPLEDAQMRSNCVRLLRTLSLNGFSLKVGGRAECTQMASAPRPRKPAMQNMHTCTAGRRRQQCDVSIGAMGEGWAVLATLRYICIIYDAHVWHVPSSPPSAAACRAWAWLHA